LILAAGFFVIGMVPAVFHHSSPGRLALTLSIFFAATGVLVPNVLRHIHRVWISIGNILGWINFKLLLSVLFNGIVTPVRLFMTLIGTDPINRKFDAKIDTYRVLRKPREASHMRHQF